MEITMLKLFCLVCWELLKLLHGENQNQFQVHGHHNSLFHINLPSWLPKSILQTMVAQFSAYLKSELDQVLNFLLGHWHNKSTGSVSGDSVLGMTDLSNVSMGLGIIPDNYE